MQGKLNEGGLRLEAHLGVYSGRVSGSGAIKSGYGSGTRKRCCVLHAPMGGPGNIRTVGLG